VVLLPTVADCAHVVGLIMFEWGAMHLSRSSGVSHAFVVSSYYSVVSSKNARVTAGENAK
jgi:hypothetical protein